MKTYKHTQHPHSSLSLPKWMVLTLLTFMALGCRDNTINCPITPNIVNQASDVYSIHDPTMIKENGAYYLFSSSDLGNIHTSQDFENWQISSTVFSEVPLWAQLEFSPDITGAVGAPDISYFQGRYILFYQTHIYQTCDSGIGLATNFTLDSTDPNYEWIDHGLVLRSKPYLNGLDIICGSPESIYNALDAHLVVDQQGDPWLAFGSTIGGIKITPLDPLTLKPNQTNPEFTTIAARPLLQEDPIIEGAYIIHRDGYYYLFVSHNHCCMRADTDYEVRVGRSKDLKGPYLSRDGWPMVWQGGTLVIKEDGDLIGTGHNSIFSEAGTDWLVHHAYDAQNDYQPLLNVRKINWEQGWPTVCQE